MADSDGIGEAFEQQLRAALMSAGRIGERLARLRTDALGNDVRREQASAADDQARYEALRTSAVAQLSGVNDESWWQGADSGQIAETYQTAVSWAGDDPTAAAAAARIRDEVQSRYGVDVDEIQVTVVDDADVRARAERARANEEAALAAELMADVEAIEHAIAEGHTDREPDLEATRHEADVAWDSASRREAHAEQIRNAVIKTLNNHEFYLEKQSFPTVGVDLTYAHKAWSAGILLDARPGFAVLGRGISGGGSTGGGTKD